MAEVTNPSENDATTETSEDTKKQWQLNALILAGVFLLSVVLPPEYKAYSPLLFVIPFISKLVNKMRHADENPGNALHDHTHSPPGPDHRITPPEPYSYKPKNPKDPRKYKPIG